jgi:hypothetical protein
MKCLYSIHEEEKRARLVSNESGWLPGSSPEKAMDILHEYAKTLVTYAGLNRFHMPADTYAQLMKMEVNMS